MKPQSILKWLLLAGSSAALSIASVHAEPEKDKKGDQGKGKAERVEKKSQGNTGKKAEKKAENREQQKDRAENRREKAEDRREQAENRQERREDQRERAEDKRERIEDRQERAEDRREDRERRIYKRGEFRERFVDRDRDHIITYFAGHKGHSHGLPPGLASKWDNGRRLPAGWRDRVVTGYVIEDDWRPYFEPVPYSWFPGITVVPDTQLYWYGDRVVRVYEPTREVVDVVIVPSIHIDL